MFRTPPIEPKKEDRTKEEVRATVMAFVVICALIRFVPIAIRKISS